MFFPASCSRNAEWPIHVAVGSLTFALSAAASVFTNGIFQPPGGGCGTPFFICSHFQSQKLCFASCG